MGRGAGVAFEVGHAEVRLFRFRAPDKARPVLVLTRNSALRFLSRVTIAPITSQIRNIPTEVAIGVEDGMRRTCAVNLDNVVTVPKGELGRLVTQLSASKMAAVCAALEFALGCRMKQTPQ